MPLDRFLISPINTGLQTDVKPWQILDDAFTYLQNVYVFRGRVRKRFGSLLMGTSPLQSQLRINLGNTDGSGNKTVTVPGSTFLPGQQFSVGTQIFTVIATGTPGTMLSTGTATGTFNTSTGQVIVTGAAATTALFYYPAQPVMGITQYLIGAVNNHPTYAFDTQFAYVFTSGTGWARSGTALWHGSNLNYFWPCNWTSIAGDLILFVSNFNFTLGAGVPAATDDPIWYNNNGTWTAMLGSSANGIFFLPGGGAVQAGPFVQTARIIVAFRNRLVLLNTVENNNSSTTGTGTATQYVNRARFSFNGSPLAVNAWYEPNQTDASGNVGAGGGFIDASTDEQIISAQFIKDRLIVYFERSTWELAYTGNEILPFIWNRLNTELGSQSTFSTIPFDKSILTIGNTGVHDCNGSNVLRIDDKIPDEIFEFESKANGNLRTVGIRDYYNELAIWTFVSDLEEPTQTFPNQLLIYNYKNDSWALFDDCFTFFGYFEQQQDSTWALTVPQTWEQANYTWNSGNIQANQRQIVAGTPQGYVVRIADDSSRNAPGMNLTDIGPLPMGGSPGQFSSPMGILNLTIYNHNLSATPSEFPNDQDFIFFENIMADAGTMAFLNGTIFPVYSVIDANTVTINTFGGLTSGTYYGGGTITRVSNTQLTTKQFNPYVDKDRNVYVQRIDFGVSATESVVNGTTIEGGQITVDYYPSSSSVSMIGGGVQSGAIMGNSILETYPYPNVPLEAYQDLLWHPVYFQTQGQFIQFSLYLSADQMINPTIAFADFELQGMIFYTQPTNARLS